MTVTNKQSPVDQKWTLEIGGECLTNRYSGTDAVSRTWGQIDAENLDAVIPGVGNIHRSRVVDRDARGLVEFAIAVPFPAPFAQKRASPREDLHPVIRCVDDVYAARFVDDETLEMKARVGLIDFGVTFPAWGGTYDVAHWTMAP